MLIGRPHGHEPIDLSTNQLVRRTYTISLYTIYACTHAPAKAAVEPVPRPTTMPEVT